MSLRPERPTEREETLRQLLAAKGTRIDKLEAELQEARRQAESKDKDWLEVLSEQAAKNADVNFALTAQLQVAREALEQISGWNVATPEQPWTIAKAALAEMDKF